jgi:hypothetical protein
MSASVSTNGPMWFVANALSQPSAFFVARIGKIMALLSKPTIGRSSVMISAAAHRTLARSDNRHRVPAFSLYLLLQLLELFAIASYQYDFAVLDHLHCRSSANPRGRAGDDVRLVLGRIVHGNGIRHR